MYSWGDDRSTWKNPGAYDFSNAKKAYVSKLEKEADKDRTYLKKTKPNIGLVDPLGRELTTNSENPIIVAIDGTGSMKNWPAEIFDRLPLFCQTLGGYKQDVEFAFAVIGDADIDEWPLQIGNFESKPKSIDAVLNALHAEGGGGPGFRESYELFAHFVQEHVKTPKAQSPFLFIMGDEAFYEKIATEKAKKYIGDTLQGPEDSRAVWQKLTQRFDLYFLRKPYESRDEEIRKQWGDAIGEQKIIPVYESTRIVDIAMGIVAKKWGQIADFKASLSARQDEKGMATVMDSLRAAPEIDLSMKSKVTGAGASKKSKLLAEG